MVEVEEEVEEDPGEQIKVISGLQLKATPVPLQHSIGWKLESPKQVGVKFGSAQEAVKPLVHCAIPPEQNTVVWMTCALAKKDLLEEVGRGKRFLKLKLNEDRIERFDKIMRNKLTANLKIFALFNDLFMTADNCTTTKKKILRNTRMKN